MGKVSAGKRPVTVEEYFSELEIVPTQAETRPKELKRLENTPDMQKYYGECARKGLDIFLEGLDYEVDRKLFPIVLEELRGCDDIFEPCCFTGIFGGYIARNIGGKYLGMDINKPAIRRAEKRASYMGLKRDMFVKGDAIEYSRGGAQHEAVIGRFVLNCGEDDINGEMLEAVAKIGDRCDGKIVLIEPFYSPDVDIDVSDVSIDRYRSAFRSLGFTFDVLTEPVRLRPGSRNVVAVVKAERIRK